MENGVKSLRVYPAVYKNVLCALLHRMNVLKVPDATCKSCYFVIQLCGVPLPGALFVMAAARRAGRPARTAAAFLPLRAALVGNS